MLPNLAQIKIKNCQIVGAYIYLKGDLEGGSVGVAGEWGADRVNTLADCHCSAATALLCHYCHCCHCCPEIEVAGSGS